MERKRSFDKDLDFVPGNKRRKTSPSPCRGGRGTGGGKNRGRGRGRGKNRGLNRGSHQNFNKSIPRGTPANSGQTTSRGSYRGNPKGSYYPRSEYPDGTMSEPGHSPSAIAAENKISEQDVGQSRTEQEREYFTNEAKSASNAAKESHPNEKVVLIVGGISHNILAKDLKEEQIRAVQFLQHSIRDHPVTAPSPTPDEVLNFKCPTDIKATTTSLGAFKGPLAESKPGQEIIVCPTSHTATNKVTAKINHVTSLNICK